MHKVCKAIQGRRVYRAKPAQQVQQAVAVDLPDLPARRVKTALQVPQAKLARKGHKALQVRKACKA